MADKIPQCFLSYSWDSEDHKDWVASLATELTERGIHVRLDRWDAKPGLDLGKYMEGAVADSSHVLVVCTPEYASKANEGIGGVGYEKTIITGEVLAGISSKTKFIPIIRRGSHAESVPIFLRSKRYIDFTDDSKYQEHLDELIRHLRSTTIRSDAFVLGTTLVVNINAVTQEPRQEDHVTELWHSIEGLCRNIGVDVPSIPGRKGIIGGNTAFKETMEILRQLKQTITKRYGPQMANPFWLGAMGSLGGQFLQNPKLAAKAEPLLQEIEKLGEACSIPRDVIQSYLSALRSRDPEKVKEAIMLFTRAVSDALAEA
jgi:hypothetical protein